MTSRNWLLVALALTAIPRAAGAVYAEDLEPAAVASAPLQERPTAEERAPGEDKAPLEKTQAPEASAPPAATTTTAAQERTRVLLLDLASNGVDEHTTRTIGSLLAVELNQYRELDVLTGDDIRRTMELEVVRHSAGCDDVSCLGELAGALGADLVIYGDAGSLGSLLLVNLSLFDTSRMTSIGRVSLRGRTLEELPDSVRPRMRELLAPYYTSRGLELPHAAPSPPPDEGGGLSAAALPWVVVGTGGVGLLAGVAFAFAGAIPYQQFHDHAARLDALEADGPDTLDDARAAHALREQSRADWQSWGQPVVIVGSALVVVGVALVAGGIAWALLPADEDGRVTP